MPKPEPLTGYYCWFKLVDILDIPAEPLGTGKPPKKKAYVSKLLPQNSQHVSACFHVDTDSHKPGTLDVFDISGEAFPSEQEALDWSVGKGKKWIAGAKNCVLVGFSFDIPKNDVQDAESMRADTANEYAALATGNFPVDDWTKDLRDEFHGRGQPKVQVLGQVIELAPPEHFADSDECAAVLALKDKRTEDRVREIIGQAINDEDLIFHAITNPLSLAGIQDDPETARRVARYVFEVIRSPTYTLKAYFNRARPWNACGATLEPIFKKGYRLYPGHPSYPSAHSTQVHALAFLFAERYPALKATLLSVANRIAVNREVAGVHFSSDSAAGQWLGERLASAIVGAASEHQDDAWQSFKRDFDALGVG